MKKSKKKDELTDPIGKTTVLALTWKDWKKELPKNGERIYIIIKAKNGLVPVTGCYFDETLPATGPFKKSRWQQVKFDDVLGTAILGGEGGNCLVAWAKPRAVGKLLNVPCVICKNIPCQC